MKGPLYLDANVFVYAALDKGVKGEASRAILRQCEAGLPAYTSTLSIDEVVWAVRKASDRVTAVAQGRRLVSFPWLRWVNLTIEVGRTGLDLMDTQGLDPRDALHAASAQAAGCQAIASDDPDFDKSPVRRQKLA